MYEALISTKMCELREQQGLTTTALAKKVGISQAQISRLENGKQGFRSRTLAKIAKALGVKPVYFWMEEGHGQTGESQATYGAPGRLGKALKHPEFRDLMEKAARIYLEKKVPFREIVEAIESC